MSTSSALSGTDVKLYVEDGTSYTVVGEQRNVRFSDTLDIVDYSSKDATEKRVKPGRLGHTLTLDALYIPDDDAYLLLKAAQTARTSIGVRKYESGVAVEEADAYITSIDNDNPDMEPSTISISLEIDGGWSAVT